MTHRELTEQLFDKHFHIASTDGKLFRQTVIEEFMAITGLGYSSGNIHYSAVKRDRSVPGLGRKPRSNRTKKLNHQPKEEIQDDNDCYSVLELISNYNQTVVGRCKSYLTLDEATVAFEGKIKAFADATWVLIQGIGPIPDELYVLEAGESELRRHQAIYVSRTKVKRHLVDESEMI